MTDYNAFYTNQANLDPTRTLTLRARWVADWDRRIAALKAVVWKSVVTNDCLGLAEPGALAVAAALPPAQPRQFSYRYSHEKVEAFMAWLREMEERRLLEIVQRTGTLRPGGEPWSNVYVRSAYQRGLQYALGNVRKRSAELATALGLSGDVLPPSFISSGGSVSLLMQQPFHADRLALMYTRVFDELKGVTAEMDKQISRILTQGIAQGLNPRQMGEQLADRVEKIGRTRGRLIARTETIHVHAQAALNEYEAIEGSTGEVVLVEWNATMDNRTRPAHAGLVDPHEGYHRLVMTRRDAYTRIGRPSCRCALLPYVPVTQGMPTRVTQEARAIIEKVLEREAA